MKKQGPEILRRHGLIMLFLLMMSTLFVNAQSLTVKGVIKDETGESLPGAAIKVQGTKVAVMSDAKGNFTVDASPGNILQVTYVGYNTQLITVGDSPKIEVVLKASSNSINEVVVVGYGTQKKENLTGSISVVNMKDADKRVTPDVARALQGQVAGVEVNGSGIPGEGVTIHIRGVSSLTNNNPLYVIDGVPTMTPFDFPTGDIESIQVIKDASAGAIYGFRGAAGVIIITTKKGKNGPLKISYNAYYGMQKNPKTMAVTDRIGYQTIADAAEANASLSLAPGNDPKSSQYISNTSTDWQKAAFKSGITVNHDLSFSGGNQTTTYKIGLGYYNQTGTVTAGPEYKRYNVSAELDGKKGILTYGGKLAYTEANYKSLGYPRLHGTGNEIVDLVTAIPTMPVYDPAREGGFGGVDQNTQRAISLNMIGVNNLIKNSSQHNRFLGAMWAQLELAKDFTYRVNVSYDRSDYHNSYFEPTYDLGWFFPGKSAYYSDARGTPFTALVENILNYKFKVGKSKVELLAGTAFQKDSNNTIFGSATNLTKPYLLSFDNVSNPANKLLFGNNGQRYFYSPVFGRINYNYDDRYLVTANYRRDGTSQLPAATRYGNFAGVSVGWNINKEHFIHLPEIISNLKLRAAYGTQGNVEALGYYDYQTVVNSNASYVFGNTLASGTSQTQVFTQTNQWEKKQTKNLGLDLSLFNDALTFTAEYYNNKISGILLRVPIPQSVGATNTPVVNAATFTNKGLEFTLTYRSDSKNDFHYDISANASTLKNRVLALGSGNNPIYGAYSRTAVGHEVGELYGYKTQGIFQNANDLATHANQINSSLGDIMFKDINGDGKVTDADQTYLGSVIPKVYFGLNLSASFKGFDASVFIQGHQGNKIANGIYSALMQGQYGNASKDELNFWTPTHTNTNVPRPVIGDPNGNGRNSDRFIQDGSFARVQTAQIGYTVPASLLTRTHLFTSLRLYVSGQNLYTLTKYKGFDPDFINDGTVNKGFDYGSFPNPRTVLVGIQAAF